jgi:periplasmic divalent cation tolerance protein
VASEIANALLEQKLAACVNFVTPVSSLYTWQGSIHHDQEILMLVKSRLELFADRLVPAVRSLHPYETPEIIALPVIAGFQGYLDWIEASTAV